MSGKKKKIHNFQPKPFQRPKIQFICAIVIIFISVFFFYHKIAVGSGHFWDDFINGIGVLQCYNTEIIAQGNLPLWTPQPDCGYPNVSVLPHWSYVGIGPLALFVIDGKLNSYWLELDVLFHVFLLGFFAFLFFKYHKISFGAAVLGGATICISGHFVFSLYFMPIMGMCWIPLVLLFIDKYFDSGKFTDIAYAGFFAGFIYLASIPQWAFYIFMLIGAYILCKAFFSWLIEKSTTKIKRIIPSLICTFGFALAVGAVALLPSIEFGTMSNRASENYQGYKKSGRPLKLLANLVFPHAFGKIDGPGSGGDFQYWGLPGHYEGQVGFWNYLSHGMYVGIIPLISILIAFFLLKKNKWLLSLILLLIFAFLYSYGVNNWFRDSIIQLIPPLKWMRNHFRLSGIWISFLIPTIFVVILNWYLNIPKEKLQKIFKTKKTKIKIVIITIFGFILATFLYFLLKNIAPDIKAKALVSKNYFSFILIIAAAFIVFIMHIRNKINNQTLCLLLLVIIWIDLYASAGKLNAAKNSIEDSHKPDQIVQILQNTTQKAGIQNKFRYAWNGHQANLKSLFFRFDSFNGYAPVSVGKWVEIHQYALKHKKMNKLYDMYNVLFDFNHIVKIQKLKDRSKTMLPRVYTVHDIKKADWPEVIPLIFTNSFNPKTTAYVSEKIIVQPEKYNRDKINIKKYEDTFRQIDVSMTSTGLLAFSEHNYPGWKAKIDGQPTKIVDVNGVFMGIVVPAGEHEIEIYFAPKSVYFGMAISGVTWLFFGIIFIKNRFNR